MKALLKLISCSLTAGFLSAVGCGGGLEGSGVEGVEEKSEGETEPGPNSQAPDELKTERRGLSGWGWGWGWDGHCGDYYMHDPFGVWECTAWSGHHWFIQQRVGLQEACYAALEECRRYQWYERCFVDECVPL